jgi:transposase-like protein
MPRIYTDENAAREHLESLLWPEGPICPHCGNADPERIRKLEGKSTRPGVYKCRECEKPFTVTVGTIFERSKIPLHQWVYATDLLTASKKGISSHQLHRMLKITYKTAWFMSHRIREAMRDDNPAPMGGEGGQIQADETMYGNTSKRSKRARAGYKRKEVVVALVDPDKGTARAFHMETGVSAVDVRKILVTNAHRTSVLVSDESGLYIKVGKEFADHQTVIHSGREYVNRNGFTTNNVENFFGIFKRGMHGVYHFCSEQHLQRYLDEFSFRYTHRAGVGIDDAARAALAIKGAAGKRLTYRRPYNSYPIPF